MSTGGCGISLDRFKPYCGLQENEQVQQAEFLNVKQ